ncbi:MAG: glycosyltransferase family 2 protein [Sedimentisphaerales bacterium]
MESSNQLNIDCSVVIPIYNEVPVVNELYSRLIKTMNKTGLYYELVFVDDGSTDGTLESLKGIADKDSKVVLIELRRNFGKAAALAAGFDTAKGRIIVSMDGDLQHAPEDIPNFIEKIEAGYDVVNGWRKRRVDNVVTRKIPSRIANWLASKASGVEIRDFGGGFKAYRREVLEGLNLYGEMHRFIPALVAQQGAKMIEVPIPNIPRPYGKSKYGISRAFRVAFDLITLRFLLGYITRPLHFFGRAASFCILAAFLMSAYILYDRFAYNVPIFVAHAPLAGLAAVLLLVGLIFVATGLIGEMISRVYFETTNKKAYAIRKIHRKKS